jgi:tetratricopeptide (TPR) repeat protein
VNFEDVKRQAEELIRAGNREQAKAVLAKIKGEIIPRLRASELASLSRRAGLLPLALQIMSPIIRPKVPLEKSATDEELATYAIILLGLGASGEALEILDSASAENADVILARAFTCINRWDYLAAIKALKCYLKAKGLTLYQIFVAKVNLAAAYVATGAVDDAKPLLQAILLETGEQRWKLLQKNCLELSAQVAIQEKDWRSATEFLAQAEAKSEKKFGHIDDFFVRKWQAIAAIRGENSLPEAIERLNSVREEAVRLHHWETVRDCDHHRALALKDPSLALQLFFGTPFPYFRERLAGNAKGWFAVPDHYIWNASGEPSSRIFEMRLGEELNGGRASLKVGKTLHLAMQALTSDFYRPFLIGALHASIFPGEYFNTVSSPRRVALAVHRLRQWFSDYQIPLSIVVDRYGYRLNTTGPYAFLIEATRSEPKKKSINEPAHYPAMCEKLRRHFESKPVSAVQIASHLEISVRAARYFLSWAVAQKKLHRMGTGRATLYRIGHV